MASAGLARRFLSVGLLLVILSPAAYVAWQFRDMPHLGYRWDDSIYWVCAKSLAEGNGYRILSLPEQPYQTKYPPLFPWLLSLVWRFRPDFPKNLPWAMLLVWLMLPVYLLLARRLFSELGFGWGYGWILCALLALNPWVVLNSLGLMSEVLFSCLALVSLILAAHAGKPNSGLWRALLAGSVAGAAYLTKSSGLALLFLAACYWFRRQRKQAVLFAVGMLPALVSWTLWAKTHQISTTDLNLLYYTDYIRFHLLSFSWGDVPLLIWKNLTSIFVSIGGLHLMGVATSFWGESFRAVVAVASIVGLVGLFKRVGMFPYGWFLVAHLLLLLAFHVLPGDPHERHMFPVLAIMLAGLSLAVCQTVRGLGKLLRASGVGQLALGGLLSAGLGCLAWVFVLSNSWFLYHLPTSLATTRESLAEIRAAGAWISRNTPADAQVLWEYRDVIGYFYSSRKGRSMFIPPKLHYHNDREGTFRLMASLVDFMRAYHLRYLVVQRYEVTGTSLDREGLRYARKIVATSPELRVAFRVGRTTVYALK